VIAKQQMMTIQKELFSNAHELTKVDDINKLYNLQYIGLVAMDLTHKVCSPDWVKLTFPDLPEADYLKVKMYDLSAEIKKCLTKKCAKDVKKDVVAAQEGEEKRSDKADTHPFFSHLPPFKGKISKRVLGSVLNV
jgi:hypothetical protein